MHSTSKKVSVKSTSEVCFQSHMFGLDTKTEFECFTLRLEIRKSNNVGSTGMLTTIGKTYDTQVRHNKTQLLMKIIVTYVCQIEACGTVA